MNKLVLVFLVAAAVQLSCASPVEFKKVNMRELEILYLRNDTLTSGSYQKPQEKCIPKKLFDTLCDQKKSTSLICYNDGHVEKPKENGKWRCNIQQPRGDYSHIGIEFLKFGCEYLPEGDGRTWAIENSCWAEYTLKRL